MIKRSAIINNHIMKYTKLFAVFLAVAGLVILGTVQSRLVKADDNSGNGTITSQGLGGSESESSSSSILNSSDNGTSGENSANVGGENSQAGQSFTINANDKVVANGTSLVSNSGQSLVIKAFGVDFNLMTTSSTSLIGMVQTSTSTIANMKTGDVIDITGQIDPNSGLITVTQIRDETMQQQNTQSIQQQIQTLLLQVKQLEDQLKSQQLGG